MLPFSILLITDERACRRAGRGVAETVVRALGRGASDVAILVRDKQRDPSDLCRALVPIVRRAGAKILVHGHARLVARLGLDGVHIASDADPREARIALPRNALLGMSRHAGDKLDVGADYVTLSPIYSPASKPADDRRALGVDGLREACAQTSVPVVALGGITERRAVLCRDAGAAAVAVIEYVMRAHDPQRAAAALRAATSTLLSASPG